MENKYLLTNSTNGMFASVESGAYIVTAHRDLNNMVQVHIMDAGTLRLNRAFTLLGAQPSTTSVTDLKLVARNGGVVLAYVKHDGSGSTHSLIASDITLSGSFPVNSRTVVMKSGVSNSITNLQVDVVSTASVRTLYAAYLTEGVGGMYSATKLQLVKYNLVTMAQIGATHSDNFLSGKRLLDLKVGGNVVMLSVALPRLITNSRGDVTGYDWVNSKLTVRTHWTSDLAFTNGRNANDSYLTVTAFDASSTETFGMIDGAANGIWTLRRRASNELRHYQFGTNGPNLTLVNEKTMSTRMTEGYWAEQWDMKRDGNGQVFVLFRGNANSKSVARLGFDNVETVRRLDIVCPGGSANNSFTFSALDNGGLHYFYGCKNAASASMTDLYLVKE
jgi:hypothetical protein